MGYDGTLKFDTKVDTNGFESGTGKIGELAKGAVKATTKVLTGAATAIAGMGTAAVKVGSEFEASMSNVAAISGAAGEELEALTAKAQEMGAKTKFSASESADAFSYMAMAGWKTADMLDGIEGIMNLAAASGEDLALTSDIVTDALTAFGLSAADSGHFADILAAASSNANTNVGLMGETFKYVAPVAGALGYSAEDTAEAIGLLANSGIKGSQAGTVLRAVISRLSTDAGATANSFGALGTLTEELGVAFFNADGSARDLSDVLADTRIAWADLTEEEAANYGKTIAGQEGLAGWLALMNAAPADIAKLSAAIAGSTDELTGYSAAEEMAATQIDNLSGQVTILKSGLEGFGILIYNALQSPLREVVETAQDMVQQLSDAFSEGGFEGLVSAVGGVLAQIVSRIAEAGPQFIRMAAGLVHSFCEGLKNAPGIGESGAELLAALADGILSVTGDLWTTAVALITELVMGLEDHLPEVLQTGIDMVLGIVDGITEALPQLLPAAVRILGALAETLVENLPALTDAAIQLVSALIDGLIASAPLLLDAADTLFSALTEALPVILEQLLAALPGIITGIVDFLIESSPVLLGTGIQLFMVLADAVREIIPALLERLPEIIAAIVEVLPELVGSVIDVMLSFFSQFVETGVTLLTALVDALPQIIETVTAALPELIGSIVETLLDALPTLVETGAELLVSLVDALPEIIEAITDVLPDIITGIVETLVGMIPDIVECGVKLLVSLVQALPEIISAIVEILPNIVEAIIETLIRLTPLIIEAGLELFMALVAAMPEIVWGIVNSLPTLIEAIVNGLLENIELIVNTGFELFTALIWDLPQIIVDIVKAGKKIITNLLDALDDSAGDFIEAGKNMLLGIGDGISNAVSSVVKKAKEAAGRILKGVKDFFGINSPSKVFAEEVGEWIPPGVGVGIEDAMPDLMKDTRAQMRQLTDEMQATVNAEAGSISFEKTGQQAYEQAQAERRSSGDVNVTGRLEGDRPIEIHTSLHIDKRKLAEEITPAVNHEMYRIDSSENNRGRGN